MPNHVHVLATFRSESDMLPRIEAWKRYQARKINEILQISGHFWQPDGFDHLIRSPEQFEYFRRYIAENPQRAKLRPGEFVHFSKPL
jgi:putative transposase